MAIPLCCGGTRTQFSRLERERLPSEHAKRKAMDAMKKLTRDVVDVSGRRRSGSRVQTQLGHYPNY